MLCENCKKNTANTYFKQTVNGKTGEIFLCSECAAKLGLGEQVFDMGMSFSDMINSLMGRPQSLTAQKLPTCPFCGMTETEFSKTGKVGCEQCYTTFKARLMPLIGKLHGTKKHLGKIPFSRKGKKQEEGGLNELKASLNEAIKAENFEQAAVLRDKIKEEEKKQNENRA